jgi:DNA repair ATPase RecN
MRLYDRINAALAEVGEYEVDSSEGGVSDPVTPQIIQADGQVGQAYDAARFAMHGAGAAVEAISNMIGDAKAFCDVLRKLSELPPETQQAFVAYDDGFAMTRIQDIVTDLEEFEQHIREAREKLAAIAKAADRYKPVIEDALHQRG